MDLLLKLNLHVRLAALLKFTFNGALIKVHFFQLRMPGVDVAGNGVFALKGSITRPFWMCSLETSGARFTNL
jgi:hypothetical protein